MTRFAIPVQPKAKEAAQAWEEQQRASFAALGEVIAKGSAGIAIDDYAEEITGDRTALRAKPASIGR